MSKTKTFLTAKTAPYGILTEMETERLARSQELKDLEKQNMIRRAKQLDNQYYLDLLRFTNPDEIVFDDGELMNITEYNQTIQNSYTYDYYNPKLNQGQSVLISQGVLFDLVSGAKKC